MARSKLFVYHLGGTEPAVEAYHLALYLGYAQQHLLRKQVLTDWADVFFPGPDYFLVRDEEAVRRYERVAEAHGVPVRPMKPSRGRLFLRRGGLIKLLRRTSKDTTELLKELLSQRVLEPRDVDSSLKPSVPAPLLESSSSSSSTDQAPVVQNDPGERSALSLEERQFEHGVLERLLAHLRELKEPALQKLAIVSAEAALGRRLEELRGDLTRRRPPAASHAPGPPRLEPGPFPESPGMHYPLKEIGRRAGGYTASAAGRAANLVAQRHGYTAEDIRDRQTPFNELVDLPDARGKVRQMYRFNAAFANEVVRELRSNSSFVPEAQPDIEDFASGAERFPKLSRGPFEDEDPATPH